MRNGTFIVIDGPDGSGKGTQTKLLAARLQREGHKVEYLSFPSYGKPQAFFAERYLTGDYGALSETSAKRASVFFAVDRFHSSKEIREKLAAGVTIISDRYVSANKGHQMAMLKDPTERKAFLDWLNDFEYGIMGVPKPDLTILLHVPTEIAFKLIDDKDARGYLDGKKRDILEADAEHLKAAEEAYLSLPGLDTVENWARLDCLDADGSLLSIEAIHERLYTLVTQTLPTVAPPV